MIRRTRYFFQQYPGAYYSSRALVFGPGVLLVLVGVLALVAPRFVMALIALFFILLGAGFCYVTWKFIQLRKKFDQFAEQFNGKIFVQGVDIRDDFDVEVEDDNVTRKVTYH